MSMGAVNSKRITDILNGGRGGGGSRATAGAELVPREDRRVSRTLTLDHAECSQEVDDGKSQEDKPKP